MNNLLTTFQLFLFIFFLNCNGSCNNEPYQEAHWVEPPLIVNCSNSPYSEAQVQSALVFWEDIGYEFSVIFDDFDCRGSTIPGSITIDVADQGIPENALGQTKVHYGKESKEIWEAEIGILVKRDLVLEHEIGHALGWKHFPREGHIMHPNINQSGRDTDGMEKK
jgi:hypothetical protein